MSLIVGDCVEVMGDMEAESTDAVVCDPPYELNFMSKRWDNTGVSYQPATWEAALRVLKPGGHLLAFGGTRTYHRLACAIEDAGFEIRDTICWLYGSGFPKSHDVSKAIDKAAGAEREVIGSRKLGGNAAIPTKDKGGTYGVGVGTAPAIDVDITAPATPEAQQWNGWGTALKPAHEPIVVARKPLIGTVAKNVLEHGTGAINVDGCRVGSGVNKGVWPITARSQVWDTMGGGPKPPVETDLSKGRWPANLVLDEQAAQMLDEQTGVLHSQDPTTRRSRSKAQGVTLMGTGNSIEYADKGGASRFFYCAKASKAERGEDNNHPTVKPVNLMRWLVRLVTPPGGTVLDPFAGSGTTGIAAQLEGFGFIGIELDEEYVAIARARINQLTPSLLDSTGERMPK